jgi:hypothetical protein
MTTRTGPRDFLRSSLTGAGAAALALNHVHSVSTQSPPAAPAGLARIQFAAIGLNHGHIYGQCEAVTRGVRHTPHAVTFTRTWPEPAVGTSRSIAATPR